MAKFATRRDRIHVYLDLDFNDSRAAYKRAVDFVDANSIKYSLSSNVLDELGGREMKSIPELFANDYVWSEANPGKVLTKPQSATRLVFELDTNNSPLACENFHALCTNSKGISKQSGLPLSYLNTKIHRYHSGLGIIQGGDIQFGNGTGGESIWGKKFKDDVKGLKLKHDKKGLLSMGNSGKNSNTSQFFITLNDLGAPICDKKHVIFGSLLHGIDTLDLMQEMIDNNADNGIYQDTSIEESPVLSIVITGCGEWNPPSTDSASNINNPDGDLIQGYYDAANVFQPFLSSTSSVDDCGEKED
jgi:peptidylprolyl isomerase